VAFTRIPMATRIEAIGRRSPIWLNIFCKADKPTWRP